MQVLVTGGSGFVGRHVVSRLSGRGDEVRVVDLVPTPDDTVECIVGDLRDRSVVEEAVKGVDAIVHLAALTSVLESVKNPHGVYETNVMATEFLLDAARINEVGRFVFASSNAVVGDVGRTSINEDSPLRPLTPYGATKAAAEMLMSASSSCYGIKTVALRFTNIYGAGMQLKDSVIARLMRAAMTHGGIEIYGDGEQLRDYLYVTDAAASIELGLSLEESDVITIGAAKSISMNELLEFAREATGVSIGATHTPARSGEMPAVIVETTHATERGFRPEYDALAGLRATWADFLARS
ncbi:MAG TPA: NAD-dependent epimerase/dehydratase family protein [Acidimicrobiales bacterium]|nr:NAD-dependent epimerase/dehydratase family protein [Acidimicrobiales bacterium]